MTASATGFKRALRTGVVLQVGQNASINITLDVGQVAETVEVQAEAPLVDTGSATLGAVIENRRVRDLPLNGRNALALTLLNSGVISNAGPTNSGFGDRGVQISSLSINGSPNSMNAQMLDGNNNVLSYVGEVGVPPAVDSVEEFKVQSGTMSAEYGFTAGGAINLVTKSGTNQFHGTLYEFLRNDKFDARNTFAARKLPLRYNQFGGSLGGPIIKNRTFGFINLEEYRLRQSTPRISTVPIDEWRHGDFSNFRTAQGQLIPIYDPAHHTPESERPGPDPRSVSRQHRPDIALRPDHAENSRFLARAESHADQRFHAEPELRGSRAHPYRTGRSRTSVSTTGSPKRNSIFFRYTARPPSDCGQLDLH